MAKILVFKAAPGGASFSKPAFFGGTHFQDIVVGGGSEIVSATRKRLVIEDEVYGLKAVAKGNFSYKPNGELKSYKIKSIIFSYQGEVFQIWKNLNFKSVDLEPAVNRFDNGDKGAIQAFLEGHKYKFILPSNADMDRNVVMMTDLDDHFIARKPAQKSGTSVFGFEGDDKINLKKLTGESYVDSGLGDDKVWAAAAATQVRSQKGDDTIIGGKGNDNLDGQEGRDKVMGMGGDDQFLSGGKGSDTVKGGRGDDEIRDEDGNNVIKGQSGDDEIFAMGDLDGGPGNDRITGRGTIRGGEGDDELSAAGFDESAKRDTFDFRLKGDKSFGDDVIENGSFLQTLSTPDILLFDTGTDVSLSYNAAKERVTLTAKQDGDVIGTVKIFGVLDTDVNDVEAAIVFG